MLTVLTANSQAGGFTIANSLRFRSSASAYLSRTPSVAGDRKTWTWSGWVKRGAIDTTNDGPFLFSAGPDGANLTHFGFASSTSNSLKIVTILGGSTIVVNVITSAIFRDPSAWYHIVLAFDTTQATAANRVKIYVNGVQLTSFSTATYPSQNDSQSYVNAMTPNYVGRSPETSYRYFDGYLTEINFIDGQALTPSSFGETSSTTGVWIPKKYTGSYGTNGFKLNFSNGTSTTTLGYDSSGNGNNWTTNNISLTAGSTYDWMIDSPTKYPGSSYGVGNYATLNPIDAYSGTMVDGNLYWYGTYGGQNGHGARSTIQVRPTGKWYVEAYNNTVSGSGNSCMLGFTASTQPLSTTAFAGALTPWIGVDASVYTGIQFYSAGVSGSLANGTVLFASYVSGDIVNFAIDFDAGKIWVGKAGTWYNSGNPASGTNATATFSVGSAVWAFWAEYVVNSGNTDRSGAVLNFGQRPFAYTPPSGYKSLCTQNLPGVTIQNGAQYMAATLFTETGSAQTINNTVNGVSFQPDLVWQKARSEVASHRLIDSVRGTGKVIYSNLTNAEATESGVVDSFTPTGYVGAGPTVVATTGGTGVAWQWKAGGTAVTNTAGSITSSVSANPTAGFSVLTFTTQSSGTSTIGHGLGAAPNFIILKGRSLVTNWSVYHSSVGNTGRLVLNTTAITDTNIVYWNNTSPTSSVFTLGTNYADSSTYVAYCFAAIPGYSAFGSYTGNGSTDGPFVYLGFRPRFVMIKNSSATASWLILDTARLGYNGGNNYLYPNLSNSEDSGTNEFDILSNGFKPRYGSSAAFNSNGATYIYACFAENPFQNALAR